MYTTINNEGLLNNYSAEPEVYYAEFPSQEEQSRYALQAGIATLFLAALALVQVSVS